jgi:hypothetical protein
MKELPRVLRGVVAASVVSAVGAGCAPQADSTHTGRSAEEIQQAINVTDSAVRLVQNLADGESAASDLQTRIRPLVEAINTVNAQIRRHAPATLGRQTHGELDQEPIRRQCVQPRRDLREGRRYRAARNRGANQEAWECDG